MRLSVGSLVWAGLALDVAARPHSARAQGQSCPIADGFLPYSVPIADSHPDLRGQGVQIKRDTFLYGPPPAGGAPFFPAGPLGNATVSSELSQYAPILLAVEQAVGADAVKALAYIDQACLRPLWHFGGGALS